MNLKQLEAEIAKLKELSPDERIVFMEVIERYEDRVIAAREVLAAIPGTEPPEGKKDPRDAFVDDLMAKSESRR